MCMQTFNGIAVNYNYWDGKIVHVEMNINGQRVWLNDAFGNIDKSLDCGAVYLI